MNKEIKMIELIVMYVEDVAQPKKVKFNGNVYIYNGNSVLQQIINEYEEKIVFLLNEKVEIIEEDKDIEQLKNYPDVLEWKNNHGIEQALQMQSEFNEVVFYKLNELVKEVNKLRKEDKENEKNN